MGGALRLGVARDARVTAYIREAPDFARPILEELRTRIHAAVPGVEETLKWSSPYFTYRRKLFFGMAAFKAHCSFGFWHPLLRGGDSSLEGMGRWKPASVADLPSKAELAKLAKRAKQLVDDGVEGPKRAPPPKDRTVSVPDDLAALLKKNAEARAAFEGFSYSKRKEYVDWIVEAKREETRAKRLATAMAQLAEGKSLMWKYERKD